MPKPTPLTPEQRAAVADDIRAGMGRNAIARKHGISAGSVTNIARAEHLWFDRCTQTALASLNRSADLYRERVNREIQLWEQLLALPQTTRLRDGKETRAYRRLNRELDNLHRHAKPR